MKILIVEDNLVCRALLEKMVKQSGHDAILANNGQKAWEEMQRGTPSMVITDWMMPEMDGLELCEKIRSSKDIDYVYIILLTARDSTKDAVKGLKAGADDYIRKPVDHEELKARIRVGERIIQLKGEQDKANAQLLQSEKMASIGQLAAGVAHEINNPTGFVSSNLKTLVDYTADLYELINKYKKIKKTIETFWPDSDMPAALSAPLKEIADYEEEIDLDYLLEDIQDLIKDCREGTERIKKIVIDLKDFAHPGEDKLQKTDINHGIEQTLNMVNNEIKYIATVNKDFGDLPLVECYPRQINQVFINILVNAAQAIEKDGLINISTKAENGFVEVKISDTGTGIPQENLSKIFDPFFTTKEVGKGTGLGMNIAYNIIKKHNGFIDIQSTMGKGTTFAIKFPVTFNLQPDVLCQ